jgi:site-specific recombinase XerD
MPAKLLHVLRLISATLLLAEGAPDKIVQMRLGQANFAITLDLSSHVTADFQRHAADKLEASIEASISNSN